MFRTMFAGLLAIALLSGPLPMLVGRAGAQVTNDTKPAKVNQAKVNKVKKAKRPLSPAQQALRARMRKCGAEWRAAKAGGKIASGMKWPQYWSACNKRLKAGG